MCCPSCEKTIEMLVNDISKILAASHTNSEINYLLVNKTIFISLSYIVAKKDFKVFTSILGLIFLIEIYKTIKNLICLFLFLEK